MTANIRDTQKRTEAIPESFGINTLWRRAPLDLLILLFALVGVFAFFSFKSPSFYSIANVSTIAQQTAIVGTAALGMTLIIIAGGIDLSVGSVIALTTVAIAWLLQKGYSPSAAALGGVGVAALCGFFNGLLTTTLKVVPFIVTLGTLLVYRGAAKGFAGNQKIDVDPERLFWLESLLASLAKEQKWMIVPPGVWMMILLAVLVIALLHLTKFGLHVFAVGSNEATARLCGVRVPLVQLAVYTLAGVFAGIAGMLQFSRLTVGDPTVAQGQELDVIAAVVIGGGSLSGGRGSIVGTLIGAFFMRTVRSGCSYLGLDNWVQEVVTGLIIVAAVALDRLRQRRS